MIRKNLFIVLKQVKLSAGLKWAVMTLICPGLSMLRIPQLDLPQKPQYQAISSS
jgi:hypothetical protein